MRRLHIYTMGVLATLGTVIPSLAYAQTQDTPLGTVSGFGDLVSLVWAFGSQVIIALSVFFIVLGAIFYVSSAGNQERIDQGKQMIFGSLIAVVIVLLSGILMQLLNKPAEGTLGVLGDVPTVINNATNLLVGVVGTFTIIMLIYSGILYATAAGKTDRIEKAQSAIKYAVVGAIIGILAFVIVHSVINFLI